MIIKGKVGPIRRDVGDTSELRLGYEGQIIIADLHGRYFEAALNGNMFIATSLTAGVALLVAHATNGNPTLWNPAGSGVMLEIIGMDLAVIDGANAPLALYWFETNPAGSNIAATGSPILTFTHTAPINAFRGHPNTSKAKWAGGGVATFATAPTFLMPAGISLNTMAAASTNAPFALKRDYEGGFLVGPGVAVTLGTQVGTTTSKFAYNIFYIETKIPNLPN
jgi:hypothetical protein